MPKNIVLCADGTGNTFRTNVSNVVRLVKSLRLDDDTKQVVCYDQGVGTTAREVSVARAFGSGARRKALHVLPPPRTPWFVPPLEEPGQHANRECAAAEPEEVQPIALLVYSGSSVPPQLVAWKYDDSRRGRGNGPRELAPGADP